MYGKIFDSMYKGTMYGHWEAIVTFQQMIVLSDSDGIVDYTPIALSATTSIPIEIILKGIDILSSDDPYSRTPGNNGKRIELLDSHRNWGWKIVNHKYYRDLSSKEDKKEKDKIRIALKREEEKINKINNVADCRNVSQIVESVVNVAYTNTDTDANTEKEYIVQGCTPKTKVLVPYDEIISVYHELLPSLAQVYKLSDTRKRYIKKLWLEELEDIESWRNYFIHVSRSDFLMGKVNDKLGRPFIATIDFIINPTNFIKIAEEKYHEKKVQQRRQYL